MSRSKEAVERGLELYRSLLGHHPAVEEEFARTRGWFGGVPAGPQDEQRRLAEELAARRHLEWFLLEHPCEHLGGVPAGILRDAWMEAAGTPEDEFAEAFINTFAGAFEVTAVDRAQGAWLRDLFGSGEYPIEEPDAAAELEQGDLVVGRVFPIGDGIFRLSPAATCFRDPGLLQAVSADAVRMRSERRGVLRIEQLELERLFFGGPAANATTAGNPAHEVRRLLAEVDVPQDRIEELVGTVEAAAQRGDGRVLTEMLNEIAFDTEADLEALRVGLVAFWNLCAAPAPIVTPPETPAAPDHEGAEAVRAALAAFDSGRAEGRDLDTLFQQLETALDCADSEASPAVGEGPLPVMDDAEIPDFPGAVGAMVEEFFWELERESETGVPAGHRSLRLLAEYGERIGVFENLSPRDLLDFAGRWVLDEGRLPSARAATDLLFALRDFCRWCDAEHAVPLTEGFTPLCTELQDALPRLVEARALVRTTDAGPCHPFKVAFVEEETVVLRDLDEVEHRVSLQPDLAHRLRPGDVVQAHVEGADARFGAIYPAVIERLLTR